MKSRFQQSLFYLFIILFGIAAFPAHQAAGQSANRLTPEGLWNLKRVSGGVLSPGGRYMVYGVSSYDLEANDGASDLYIYDFEEATTRQLTGLEGREYNPQWHPEGGKIGFLATKSGTSQLWEIPLQEDGEPQQITDYEKGIHNFRYAPDVRHISFTREVKLDSTVNELYADLPKANARLIDDLMYRHWDEWHNHAYSHLFIAPYEEGKVGEPVDVMEEEKYHTPLQPFGGLAQIKWSPEGNRIAYTSKKLNGREYTLSTNSGIYIYDLDSKTTRHLTEGMEGNDREPAFSSNGRYVAWLSMRRDGYESDRNRLFVHDFEEDKSFEVTTDFDADAHSPVWGGDNKTVYITSNWRGENHIFKTDITKRSVKQLSQGRYNYSSIDYQNGRLIAMRESMNDPEALFEIDPVSGSSERLTHVNQKMLKELKDVQIKKRMVETTDGKEMLTWVIYPPDFDPDKTYPALLYLQGGPQSGLTQFFSYRWNFRLMASKGYIVVAPNRRGVPGFGQQWKEQISKDWGGQAMDDYLSAIDDVSAEEYVDEKRLGAVGASFGGYSAYYLAGNAGDRFQTFIAHAGVFNLESMYGSTEELWFVNFDLGGPYWKQPKPESYQKFSPHDYVQNWDTPMLVIHGQEDYRVPVTQGMEAFTALRAQNIESKFLYFPEEGHWIQSPQNGVLWHRVFFNWLDKYLKN